MKAKPAAQGYRLVRDDVLGRIRSGRFKPGALLPGEVELAASFGVARATVNKAMLELVEQGYLERKRKGGTRVRSSPLRAARFAIPLIREEIEAQGHYDYKLLQRAEMAADKDLRGRLGLRVKTKLLHLLCLHLADDAPYAVEERWINLATLPEAAQVDFSLIGPNEWLVQRVPFTDVKLEVSAGVPPAHVSKHLTSKAPCLVAERTTWQAGRSVTYMRLTFRQGYKLTTQY